MYKILYILFISLNFADFFPISQGVSSNFTIDLIDPELSIFSPDNGDQFDYSEQIQVHWDSYDDSYFPEDAVSIEISTTIVPFNYVLIIDSLANNNFALLPPINSNTNTASIRLSIKDSYGNKTTKLSNGFFKIGNDTSFIDTIAATSSISIFEIDQIAPEISWLYPNNNNQFNSNETIELQWYASDNTFDGTDLIIELSLISGSEFEVIFDNISHDNFVDFIVPEINTSTAQFRVTAKDRYGNINQDLQDGFFSIQSLENSFSDTTFVQINNSENFIIDQIPPILNWIYPNGGETFNSLEEITVEWSAVDSSWDNSDISIYLSPISGSSFELIANDLPNTENLLITLPDINTETAQFKISAYDKYGNYNENLADGNFTIGILEETFSDTLFSISQISNLFTIDQIPPQIDIIFPNGGIQVPEYSEAELEWNLVEQNSQGTELNIWVSHELGGWFIPVAEAIDAHNQFQFIDLSLDGQIPERIYGLLKMQAKDFFGNISEFEYSDNYFILGDPKGDINLNFIDQEQNTLLIDWSWVDNQTIAITEEALQNLADHQLGVEYIKIFDENGIHSTSCSDDSISINTGLVELAHINMNEMSIKTISMMAGADYCALGGSRTIGYNPNGQSHVKIIAGASHNDYELIPHVPQLVNEAMMFDHSTHIITDFDIGRSIEINDNQILSVDDRDIDNFNVYSRVTNHSGSITRNCNNNGICEEGEAIANCFDDCCSTPGTGANDEWCFEQNIQGLTNYYTNLSNNLYLPNNQGSATINYRIWLLDQNGDEAVVTLDTEGIDFEGDGDLTTIYEQELGAGWNWFSFNVYLEDMNVNSVFSQFTEPEWQCDYGGNDTNCPYYIKSQSAYGIYYQGYGFYPEFTMNIEEFYKLQMNAPSQILFQGILAEPQNTPISLNSGWNWIGYVPLDPLNVNIGLSNIIENNTPYYIKSQSAYGIFYENFGFYPEFTMESHGGYMLQMIEPDILTYPTTSRNSSLIENIAEINSIKDIWSINYRDFEYSASATFKIDIDDLKISENDYIALFDGNTCIGITKGEICPINNELLFSMLFYNNEEASNNLTIEYFNESENMIFNINESINFINDSNIGDIYNPVILTSNYTPEEFILNPAYPNPFNPMTTISFEISDEINFVELSIYDLNGKKVENLFKGDLNKGQYKYDWNAKNYSSGIYFVKVISNNKQLTQKITLIK
tara:strand:- start:188 stop:3784 length:3597 start_codon:yes stop_codon:yes gene_type:complete